MSELTEGLAYYADKFFAALASAGKDGGRPDWDTYYLNMARLVSVRSLDPHTKHGCVIVDKDNRVLSLGYNGPLSNIDDSKVPLTRPEKYAFMSHSEQNAIMFCKSDMAGAKAYVTGPPCSTCTRMLLQKGVQEIICGGTPSKCIDEADAKASQALRESRNVKFTQK